MSHSSGCRQKSVSDRLHGRCKSMNHAVIAYCFAIVGVICSCTSRHTAPVVPTTGSGSASSREAQLSRSEARERDVQRHLAAALRSGAVDETPRPLVVVDLPDGTVRTLCGSAAMQAESDALAVFHDPGRSLPSCQQIRPGGDLSPFICVIADRAQRALTIVEVVNGDKPYLTSIVNSTVGFLGYAQRLSEVRRKQRLARCDD